MNWISDEALARLQSASAMPDLSGTRYSILERIGAGGMGTVYLAKDSVLDRRVALKILDVPDAAGELAARLLREAQILGRLEHPGIVPVHDAGTLADGRAFYAMKFVQGERLDRHIASANRLADRLRIFQGICDAVGFAHARGVLHRDLKPENIMVGPFGEVLVMDWGVAKIISQPSESRDVSAEKGRLFSPSGAAGRPIRTAHGAVLGTPGYMAPEQARGESEKLDERADIFSLGALLQFLLADSGAPPRLAAIALKSMAADPAARYPTIFELTQDISRYLDGLPVAAYPENILQKAARWAERYRVAIVLVLTYLLVRALMLLWTRR
jgi:eukaryotic-like serine/threonine-protein kinase